MTTILVVEDQTPIRELLEITLGMDYQVVQAADGTEAIRLARLVHPELMLLDVRLAEEPDGLTVCRTLRRDPDPLLRTMPILILSGLARPADITAGLEAGANAYLTKPYSVIQLIEMVATLLRPEQI